MEHYCKNHPNKKALSLCHSCGEYFCSDCLTEGKEYYYCKNNECAKQLTFDSPIKSNSDNPKIVLSKELKIIKRTGILFIVLSLIFLIFTIKIAYQSAGLLLMPEYLGNIKHFFGIVAKYSLVFLIIILSTTIFSLFSSINLYLLKKRKLFLYSLLLNTLSVILYNVFVYSYFDFFRSTNIVSLGAEGYRNFWGFDKFYIAIISTLIIIFFVYLFKKFSTENIKKQFIKVNA